jgi:pyruvate dehydrogenase kinase 2/3/4
LITFPKPNLSSDVKDLLAKTAGNGNGNSFDNSAYPAKHNPSIPTPNKKPTQNIRKTQIIGARYYGRVDDFTWPPEVRAYNNKFTKALTVIKRRHDPVVTTMAQGILEYKKQRQRSQIDSQIQSFLDRFYMSRIGIRMLIGQHIALNNEPARKDYVGIICTRTNVQALAQEAIDNARFICEDYYGLFDAPKVQLICRPDLEFMYVPG